MTDPASQTKIAKKRPARRPAGSDRVCDPSVWLGPGPKRAPQLNKGERRAKRLRALAKREAEEEVLVVSGIVSARFIAGGVTEFLVRWEDYAAAESSWEPYSNLGPDGQRLAKEYLGSVEERARHGL